ncbi:FACT complex subunit SSRP1-like isoform X2 [Vigna unguiculata]|uniref:FACT complex subunit SSRP1-like isoform X2 n=1 Tax=Vigna unguiculata TaxID=3917 RepID=UPI0010164DA8|nr:FACT complex subunit SSRP1-like isoform X2 [Vigna unguiculata]
MTDVHQFNNITLGGRGGTNPGQMKVYSGGIVWKRQGGGKLIEVDKSDIEGVTFMKVPKTNQLGVQIKDGLYYKFTGFRDQDVASLTNFFQNTCGITVREKQLSVSGRNWGEVDLNGNMLAFMVGSKQAFEVSLADVSQTQLQGKNDVILEFHVDDTTGANEKDSLMEISFHIPSSNTQFVGDEKTPPAEVFRSRIMSMADVGAGGEDAVVTFESIAILTPRGRYIVELHMSFLRLQGQANDFKIQYSSVVRLFLLPKGLIHEVFTTILRGLSGAKVTKPGKFRSCQDGYAVKSSLKAEDGILYPLEKSFFFLPKPPTLILHEEIDYVEFERHAAGGSNMHYFDLLIRLKSEQEHLFRNIQRNEYHNLYEFISAKGLKIMNLGDGQPTAGIKKVLENDDDDAVDPHLERIKNAAGDDESDEEDSDFVADKDDEGSPTDDSGGDDSDASKSGDEKEKPVKKEIKKDLPPKASTSKKKPKDDEDGKKKKQKKKKDPNAPKRAMSGFMFFSKLERENLKKTNPGISFTDVGRVLGEKWKKMTAEEKEPYEAKAREDKQRYKDEISGYKNPQPMNIDSANVTDSA